MNARWKKFIFVIVSLSAAIFLARCDPRTFAQSNGDKLRDLNRQIEEYQREITKLQGEANTLANQIAQFDAQIRLTQLKISQTEEKIILLIGRIDQLEVSLNSLSNAFSSRVVETYKMTRLEDPAFILASVKDLAKAVSRYHYLKIIQEADRSLIKRLHQAQNTYKDQKLSMEELKEELDAQKETLDVQKAAKAQLLTITKNDEKRYQELLATARAELAAISAIIAGRGTETEVRTVSEGEQIASILTHGPNLYACSTGPHLHFEVAKDGVPQNPFGYLSEKSLIWDNADSPQNGSGSWRWPLNDPIRVTQGFGNTSYSSRYAGGIHTGIDMTNDGNRIVFAVKPGVLYRGGIGCRGGTLQYVRVKQGDGLNTYYLHVNY